MNALDLQEIQPIHIHHKWTPDMHWGRGLWGVVHAEPDGRWYKGDRMNARRVRLWLECVPLWAWRWTTSMLICARWRAMCFGLDAISPIGGRNISLTNLQRPSSSDEHNGQVGSTCGNVSVVSPCERAFVQAIGRPADLYTDSTHDEVISWQFRSGNFDCTTGGGLPRSKGGF